MRNLSCAQFSLGVMLILGSLMLACAPVNTPSTRFPQALPEPVVTLNPGDSIEVKFLYWPELSQIQTIRPDGRITLELVGEVPAAGLTAEQLNQQLIKLYKPKIKEPVITVIIRFLANQKVYVGGEVLKPGLIPVLGRITVLEAIMSAGGFDKRSARLRDVVVIRRNGDKNYATKLDLRQAFDAPESNPFYLAPHDIVFVPRTRIDALDQWVAQYINQVVPSTLFNYSHRVNPDTTIGYGTN